MPRFLRILCCGIFILDLAGCASVKKTVQPEAGMLYPAGPMSIPVYSGPRARITLSDFDVKASKATSQIGAGLRSMLAAAFLASGRFSLVDAQALSAQSVEKDASVKSRPADLVVMVALTEFEPQASGGRGGIGGGGGVGSGTLGGLLGTDLNKARTVLEVRLVDTFTSEVLATGRIEGQAVDTAGVIMNGVPHNLGLGSGLSAYANTPMEKAIRICIAETVKYISAAVPASYYKY